MFPTSHALVESLHSDASFKLGWSLIERFAILVRESGSTDERAAAHFIVTKLKNEGVPVDVFEPDLYLSIPKGAGVEAGDDRFEGKAPSFSASTGAKGLVGTPVHVPAEPASDAAELFAAPASEEAQPDVAGKIVVTEGLPMPATVARFEAAGAVGQVYVNPGSRVHWGICTTVWGTPGLSGRDLRPKTPVVALSRPDGDRLLEAIGDGADEVTLHADLAEGWHSCQIPVARIEGRDPEFVLAHGHYDSWDVGIGDNAVGDATLLEIARVVHRNRDSLRRSLRVAWWPAHSTGRYAGSTWYADHDGLELRNRCVAAMNVDSPGCKGATAFDRVPWMAEAEDVAREAVRSVTGVEPTRERPLRAGDYSFNELGLSSLFMLLSNIPEEERERLGYYPVGGCGGNIAWHTEHDRIEVADREHLKRDLRIYLSALGRFLNDEIVPLDYRRTAAELDEALARYESTMSKPLAKIFNLVLLRKRLAILIQRLDAFYARLDELFAPPPANNGTSPAARRVRASESARANAALLRVGRILVNVGYCKSAPYEQDPALPMQAIPRLAPVDDLERLYRESLADEDADEFPFVLVDLRRETNKVMDGFAEATRILDDFLEASKS